MSMKNNENNPTPDNIIYKYSILSIKRERISHEFTRMDTNEKKGHVVLDRINRMGQDRKKK